MEAFNDAFDAVMSTHASSQVQPQAPSSLDQADFHHPAPLQPALEAPAAAPAGPAPPNPNLTWAEAEMVLDAELEALLNGPIEDAGVDAALLPTAPALDRVPDDVLLQVRVRAHFST